MRLTAADALAAERELCRRSLAYFARRAWPVLEPASALKWGWALDAICQHLEAVTDGRINRLLMTVPPGMMKSLLTAVIWPAWEWGPRGMASTRYISTAHKQDLAVRDNLKCRRLVQSDWYQARWPVRLTGDQNAKTKFENERTGFREAMAFTSMTGARGDRVILDDPLSADDGNSPAALLAAERTFLEALPTRVNSEASSIVVIMQRLHERDTAGLILSRGLPYEHLCLPMRFEAGRRCGTSIGFLDPREVEGELLFPERFGEDQVAELERTMGAYAAAGQLQQRPAPREGGLFKRHWFEIVDAVPAQAKRCRAWDLAATEGGGDWTAGVRVAVHDGIFYVEDVQRAQLSPGGVERLLKSTATSDGQAVSIRLPQDPGAAGKTDAASKIKLLAGFDVRAKPVSGSKEQRAAPAAAQAEAGNVKLVRGGWNEMFLDEISLFPGAAHDDQVDAFSDAVSELALRAPPARIVKVSF